MMNTELIYVRIATPEHPSGKTTDNDVRLRAHVSHDESPIDLLAILLAGNLNAHRVPRPYCLLAMVLLQLQQWAWPPPNTTRGRAERKLLDAARDVVEAWQVHDEKLKQQ